MNQTNEEVKLAAQKAFKQYEQTFKDLAKYDRGDTIETHTKKSLFWDTLVPIFLLLAITYFTAHFVVWMMR